MVLATAALHFGEEPPLTPTGGSGAFFFANCQLNCPFCQNYQISHFGMGKKIDVNQLVDLMLTMQQLEADNINLVSATPYLPSIITAIKEARGQGLILPIVWNSGGYEEVSSLKLLADEVKIYLPDLKTLNTLTAKTLYKDDYVAKALESLHYLAANFPLIYENGLLKQGVILRHLALPAKLEETEEVIAYFAKYFKDKILLSLLTQYTPVVIPGEGRLIPNRCLNKNEEQKLIKLLQKYDINEGFFQDLVLGDWLPNFKENKSFKGNLAKTIWHWSQNTV